MGKCDKCIHQEVCNLKHYRESLYENIQDAITRFEHQTKNKVRVDFDESDITCTEWMSIDNKAQ